MGFISMSGDAPPEKRWRYLFGKNERFIDTVYMSDSLPGWLSEKDVDVYAQMFERASYRGGLNWYRNVDRDWERMGFPSEAKINHFETRLSQDSVTGQEHEPGQLSTHLQPHLWARGWRHSRSAMSLTRKTQEEKREI
jgi:hypothetical protein